MARKITVRFRICLLIPAILFAVPSPYGVWAQVRSADAKPSAHRAISPAKKTVAKQGGKENGISASPPADLSLGKGPKEFDWSGSYGGVHGGALGGAGRNIP